MKFNERHLQILAHFQNKAKEQQELTTASTVEVQKLKKEYSDVVTKIHENRLTKGVMFTRNLKKSRMKPRCSR